jgi:hypothetical protein
MRPIPADSLGHAHGLLRAIDKRGRLRTDEFVTEFSLEELFPPDLENALGRMRHFISYARAAGLVKEDRGVVELTDIGRRYIRSGEPDAPFAIGPQQAEWLRRQLREKHMTDSIFHGLAIGLSLLASTPPGTRVSTMDFGRSMAYLGRAGWDNENTLQSQGERHLILLQQMELIDGEHRLAPTGDLVRGELTLPVHMSLPDIAAQLNPGGADAVRAAAEQEWAVPVPPPEPVVEAATPPEPAEDHDDNGYHTVADFGSVSPPKDEEEASRPPIVPRTSSPSYPSGDASPLSSGDPLAGPPSSVPPPTSAPSGGDPLAADQPVVYPPSIDDAATVVASGAGGIAPQELRVATPPGNAPRDPAASSVAPPIPSSAPPVASPNPAAASAAPPAVPGPESTAPSAPAAEPPSAVSGAESTAPPVVSPDLAAPAETPDPVGAPAVASTAPPVPPAGAPPVAVPGVASSAPAEGTPAAAAPATASPAPPVAVPGAVSSAPARRVPSAAAHEVLVEAWSIRAAAEEAGLRLPDRVYANVAAALNAGKHLVLTGALGSGKTSLALAIARAAAQAGHANGATVVTGAPARSLLTDAAARGRWVIVDELDQADLDAALKPLSTLLAGVPVTLDGEEAAPAAGWRIVATWNGSPPRGASVLRRFAAIDVARPPADELRALLQQDDPEAQEAVDTLLALGLPVGAGVLREAADHIKARQAAVPTDASTLADEAVAAYLSPVIDL